MHVDVSCAPPPDGVDVPESEEVAWSTKVSRSKCHRRTYGVGVARDKAWGESLYPHNSDRLSRTGIRVPHVRVLAWLHVRTLIRACVRTCVRSGIHPGV